jgi:5-methylcytosine-specific restriction endonuclease McrA
MPKCMYPQFAAITGFKKGCRCLRCVEGKRKYYREYQLFYNHSSKGQAAQTKYRLSEKGKDTRRNYANTEKGKAIFNAKKARRKALMDVSALSEMQKKEIVMIYEECQRISKQTGIPHHVDHIIPLAKGGLHHPSNLQILTAEENLKKSDNILTACVRESPQPDAHSPCHPGRASRSPVRSCGSNQETPHTT